MKDPGRDVLEADGMGWVAAAANRCDGRKAIGIRSGPRPGAEAAHAKPREINPVRINLVVGQDVIQQGVERLDAPAKLRGLRRYYYERKVLLVFHHLGGPV